MLLIGYLVNYSLILIKGFIMIERMAMHVFNVIQESTFCIFKIKETFSLEIFVKVFVRLNICYSEILDKRWWNIRISFHYTQILERTVIFIFWYYYNHRIYGTIIVQFVWRWCFDIRDEEYNDVWLNSWNYYFALF